MAGYYKLKTSANGKFMFNLHAGNHEIILTSQMYEAKSGAQNGIASVQTNSPKDDRYEKKENGGSYTFNLKAGNNEVIGRSESYTSASARDKGIASVKENGPTETIKDET